VDEKLSGQQSDNLIGRHAAVRASNPQLLWLLEMRELLEEAGIPGSQLGDPPPVIVEELFQLFHRDDKLIMRFGTQKRGPGKESLTDWRGADSVRR
jgi:hypothetical protein